MQVGSLEVQLLANVARLQSDMDKANRTVTGAMQKVERSVTRAMSSIGALTGGLSFAAFIKSAVQAEIQIQKITNTLKFATGSAATAAREMEFLRSTTARLGLEFNSAASAYGKLAASAKGTNLEGQRARDVFEAVAKASTVMGLSADETEGALRAIQQMMSKGTVASEELRGQLGERLPGAFQIAARAMGVTTQELGKMLEQGQVVSDEFLPRFAAELDKTLGNNADSAANSALSNLNRLQNAWTEFKTSAAEGGIMTLTLKVVQGSTDALKWFDHFVFRKGELADIQRHLGDIKNLESAQERLKNLRKSWFASEKEILQQEKKVRDLQVKLDPSLRNPNAVPGLPTDNSSAAPSFGVIPSAQDITEIHRRQEEAARAQKALADKAIAEQERVSQERLKDLQAQIDFETEMTETRSKKDFEAAQERKQAEIDSAKERADAIAKINQQASDDYLQLVREQEAEAKREYERTADNLTRAITDGLMRGFEKGKSIAENFLDTLKNIFQSVILEPTIRLLVEKSGIASLGTAISSMLGSGAAFGETAGIPTSSGGFGGILSTGKTLFDGITNGFKSLNFSLTNSIAEFGANIANGMGGIRDAIGGFIGTNSSMIANGLSFLPAAFSLLQGDLKGAAFQGAGAAIGTYFGGPIGGAIGSFLGGAVGGLFGNGKGHRAGAGAAGSYSNGVFSNGAVNKGSAKLFNSSYVSGLQGLNSAFSGNLGSFLSAMGMGSNISTYSGFKAGKEHGTYADFWASVNGSGGFTLPGRGYGGFRYDEKDKDAWSKFVARVLGEGIAQAIQYTDLGSGIKSLFAGLTDQTAVTQTMQAVLNLNSAQKELDDRFGLTVDQAAQVAKATGLAGDALIEFTTKLANSAIAFKSQSEILVEARLQLTEGIGSLPADINAFDAILKGLDTTTSAGIAEFQRLFALRDQFAQFTATIDGLKAGVTGAVFGLMSPSQQLAQMQADLQTLFGNLGMSVPNSVQELIALGNSIDYTTETGLDLAAAFPTLVQAFLNTKNGVDGLASSLNALDPMKFLTAVDYMRAQAYQRNGMPLRMLPSYDVGTEFVPQDGPAMIHRGERILTSADNSALMRKLSSPDEGMRELASEISSLRAENRNMRDRLDKIVDNTKRSREVLESATNGATSLKTRTA